MGNLVTETPYSEITATLEALAHLGVERRHLKLIREDADRASVVAQTMIAGYVLAKPELALKVWCTIKLGIGLVTAYDFSQALKKANCCVTKLASHLLGQPGFGVVDKEIEVRAVVLTTAELTGWKEGGTTAEVFAGAKRLGLGGCPAEVGPQLCLRFPDHLLGEWLAIGLGEWLAIGMEPISDSGGNLRVFVVERHDFGWLLDGFYGNLGTFWKGDDRWVFLLRE